MDPRISTASETRPPPVHAALQIALVALLLYACSRIMLPFVGILLWSLILAVMLYPLQARLRVYLGNSWSAALIGVVGVAIMLVPIYMVVTSLGSTIYFVVAGLQDQSLTIPPPPAWVESIPVIGRKIAEGWSLVATNMPGALAKYGPMLGKVGGWLASLAGGLATGGLSFVVSIGIAAIIVAFAEQATSFARRLTAKVANSEVRGGHIVALTAATIRGVAIGVVGVGVIQTLLVGIGFFAVGMPAAGALTLITFLLSVVQVPVILIALPAIAYVFSTHPTTPAVIFTIWILVAGLSDNVLKPMMLGRGLEVPMPVILIGVLGGMIADGLLGLFIGPVLLAVGYVLLIEWVNARPATTQAANDGTAP